MSRRRIGLGVLALVAVLVVAGVVVSRSASAHEVFLEPANSVGAHPFTTAAAEPMPSTTATTASATETTAEGATTTTALFGGTGSQKRCDPDALVAFLMAHRDKATAWVEALNDDPMLRWSKDGTDTLFSKLTVDDIASYVAGLTPTFLAKDTRVENHGFFNGKATPHESVLQAGTAVLVDKYGVPRTRCACGNPLDLPEPVDHIRYVGTCWPGCHDHPYCSGGDCAVTTTTEPTSTTEPATTTTQPCDPTTGEGCGPPVTQPPGSTTSRPPGSTTTSRPPTSTTRTTQPPPSTTRTTRTTSPPTTQPRNTTPTTQPGKP